MIFSLLTGFLPLLVLGAIIATIVAIARHNDEADLDPGIGTVRRLVLYALLFFAAMIGPTGVALLLGGLFDALTGDLIIANANTELATGLSLTIVGGLAWGILWRIAASTVTHHPVEAHGLSRHLYFASARGVTLLAMLVAGYSLVRWAFRLDSFEGNALSFLLVAAAVWYFHERLQAAEVARTPGTRSIGRLYLFAASFVGLAVFASGIASLLIEYFNQAYDALLGSALLGSDGPAGGLLSRGARGAAALLVPGAIAWAGHWWRARPESDSTLWRVYVYLGGLGVGITTAIVGASVALHLVLQWFFGVPASSTAAAHFESVPDALAGLIVGLLLWGYHRAILEEHTRAVGASPSETERVYRYLAAAAGLVTLVTGLSRVLATVSDLLAVGEASLVGSPGWWQNQLVLGVTLLLVGVPLWVRYWRHVEAHVESGGEAERASLSRRIFLYGVFGVSGLFVLGALSTLLFEVFQALLKGDLSTRLLHDARWSIGILLSVSGVALYYWQVLRADQQALPAAAEAPRTRTLDVTVVNGEDGGALARRIHDRLPAEVRARVRTWARPDLEAYTPADADLDALVRALEAAPGDRVLVLASPEGASVIPYSPR